MMRPRLASSDEDRTNAARMQLSALSSGQFSYARCASADRQIRLARLLPGMKDFDDGPFGEDPQMAGPADGGPDPVLVRERPVLRHLPDRAGAQRARHNSAGGPGGAVRRRRGR